MLGCPVSTLRRYSVDYAQHLSESARPARGKRHYTDADVLILRRVRELVSAKKSPEEINKLIPVLATGMPEGPSALALLPDVAQAFEELRAAIMAERSERERLERRLDELQAWVQAPWYKRIGKKPPDSR